MNITLLADNPRSWIIPYAIALKRLLRKKGHRARLVHDPDDIPHGDIAVYLGCERVVPERILRRNAHNIVVHESALPKGRGWSPLTWQILEGKNIVPITLFEAAREVDSGRMYYRDTMRFRGDELVDELRAKQGEKTIELVMKFVTAFPDVRGKTQKGRPTFYPRRRREDSELDARKPLKELFNQLRVADNERYPAFFRYKGYTYFLKIYKGHE